MADVLIDLGKLWGHVIPLSTLEHITHIKRVDKRIIVECTIPVPDDKPRIVEFESKIIDSEKWLKEEKNRLIGLSNGIINNEDMNNIIDTMEIQTGKKIEETLDKPVYDLHYVRRIWASLNDKPYFRFILQYDPENQNINAVEEHNDDFTGILGDWLDEYTMKVVTDLNDRLLVFAYNAIERMAEPVLPMTDNDEFLDPTANIPVMANASQGLATQSVDLANIKPDDIMMRT